MKKILYEDCNNNASFIRKLFTEIQSFSDDEIKWNISNLDFIPVDKGDYIGGIPDPEMEVINNFKRRILDEHEVIITHSFFMSLLENIKTIYEGKFTGILKGKIIQIKVFDGDIIEIDGEIETKLKL